MRIDELPSEMLMTIFSFLPTYREVLQVNKLFYSVACKVNSNNYLRIDPQFIESFLCNNATSSQLLQSMKSSIRQISKVEIRDCTDPENFIFGDQRQKILSVIETISSSIKFLKLKHVYMEESTLLEILSLTPNIQELILTQIICYYSDQSPKRVHCYEDVNLKMLKSVKTIYSEFGRIFNRLPDDNLKQLQIYIDRENKLDVLLNRQRNIKDLKLLNYEGDQGVTKDIFVKLTLDSLNLNCLRINSVTTAAILSHQPKLKKLTLYDKRTYLNDKVNVDERVMKIVVDLLELEVLAIDVTWISASSLVKIRKLNKLKDLTLRCDDDDRGVKLQALAELDNPSIKRLCLKWETGMPVNIIGALAKSVPQLTHFKVEDRGPAITNEEQDAIMSHFNFVEVLEMKGLRHFSLVTSDYFNPKLKELTISNYYDDEDINQSIHKLFGAYPNLRKLKLKLPEISDFLDIRAILNGFTKLESLIVTSIASLIVEDLDDLYYLNDHKNSLKFVSLENVPKGTLTDDLVKKLRQNFGVVNVDYGFLTIAVDRYTMDCENEDTF